MVPVSAKPTIPPALLLPLEIFKVRPDIAQIYQRQFKYILVDEYQDTNKVQYEIVKALSWDNKNIFVVGDDYQNVLKSS